MGSLEQGGDVRVPCQLQHSGRCDRWTWGKREIWRKGSVGLQEGKEERLRWDIWTVEAVGLAHGLNTGMC